MIEKLLFLVSFLAMFLFMTSLVALLRPAAGTQRWRSTLEGLGIAWPGDDLADQLEEPLAAQSDRPSRASTAHREIRALSERVSVLERIVTDREFATGQRR